MVYGAGSRIFPIGFFALLCRPKETRVTDTICGLIFSSKVHHGRSVLVAIYTSKIEYSSIC